MSAGRKDTLIEALIAAGCLAVLLFILYTERVS